MFYSSSANLTRHIAMLHQKLSPMKCRHCIMEVTFCDKAALKKHYESAHRTKKLKRSINSSQEHHELIKKYRCSECDKSFAWSKSLKNHIDSFHKKIRPYHCDECNTSFSQKGHYTHHMKSVHLKIKPFNCKECELFFSTRVSLSRHITMMHQKLNPIRCKHCSSETSFCDKAAMNKHYESVHRKPKLSNCSICNKDFVNKKTLWKHNKRYHEKCTNKSIAKSESDGADYMVITEGYTEPIVIIEEQLELGNELSGICEDVKEKLIYQENVVNICENLILRNFNNELNEAGREIWLSKDIK